MWVAALTGKMRPAAAVAAVWGEQRGLEVYKWGATPVRSALLSEKFREEPKNGRQGRENRKEERKPKRKKNFIRVGYFAW